MEKDAIRCYQWGGGRLKAVSLVYFIFFRSATWACIIKMAHAR